LTNKKKEANVLLISWWRYFIVGASHANWRSLYRSTNTLKKGELAGEAFFLD